MNSENINSNASFDSDEISLKELVLKVKEWYEYLLSKWKIIVCFGIIGGLCGFGYAYLKKVKYTATTTFVLQEGNSSGGLGQYAGIASMVGLDVGGGGGLFQGDNILELYKSRAMIEKTLLTEVELENKKLLLIERYIDFNKLKDIWAKDPRVNAIQFKTAQTPGLERSQKNTRLQDSVLGDVIANINREYLTVSRPDKKLSIFKVEVKANDEFFAKAFNDEIVKNVNDFYLQTSVKKSLENVSILQQQVDSVRSVMDGAIYRAAAVSDATPNLNPTRQIQRIAPIQKSQFSAEASKAVLGELVKNLELSKMGLRKETPLIQMVDEPIYPLTKERISKFKGVVIGGFLGGFIICLILLVRRFFKMILV